MKRVLFICSAFPPIVGGGSIRNFEVVRGLANEGWAVTVLTVRKRWPLFDDASPLALLPASVRVVRARSPDLASIARIVRRRRATAGDVAGPSTPGGSGRLRRFVLTWLLIPDADAPWIPFAIRDGLRLLRDEPFDALVTAGPPHSAHLVGVALRARRRIRWLLDTQDPWADHPFPTHDSRLRRGVDRFLESWAFRAADVVLSATESQTSRFRRNYGDRGLFATLPNGYAEADFTGVAAAPAGGGRRLVHVGSFYGARSPGTFLEALGRVASRRPDLVADLEVLLVGYADAASAAEIAKARRDPLTARILRVVPHVSHRESLALCLGADVLLLVTDPVGGGRELIPLKVYEYLRAGRPILALVPEGETARLLRNSGGALVADPLDVEAVTGALTSILEDPGRAGIPDHTIVDSLEIGATVRGIASLISGVV